MEKKSVVITNYELINLLAWFERSDGWFKTTKLSVPIRRMFKNIQTKLTTLKDVFDADLREIETLFADDEHSSVIDPTTNKRQVKPEYIDEFKHHKYDLLAVKSEFEFIPVPCSVFENVECTDADYQFIDLLISD